MQLGSGTVDVELGNTFKNKLTNNVTFGAQGLGNQYVFSGWSRYQINNEWDTSIR